MRIAKAAYGKKADIVKIATRVNERKRILRLSWLWLNGFYTQKDHDRIGHGDVREPVAFGGSALQQLSRLRVYWNSQASGQLPYNELRDRFRALYPRYNEAFQASTD